MARKEGLDGYRYLEWFINALPILYNFSFSLELIAAAAEQQMKLPNPKKTLELFLTEMRAWINHFFSKPRFTITYTL
jgi:hypothetical protein